VKTAFWHTTAKPNDMDLQNTRNWTLNISLHHKSPISSIL